MRAPSVRPRAIIGTTIAERIRNSRASRKWVVRSAASASSPGRSEWSSERPVRSTLRTPPSARRSGGESRCSASACFTSCGSECCTATRSTPSSPTRSMNSQSATAGTASTATWPSTCSGSSDEDSTAVLSDRKRWARSARLWLGDVLDHVDRHRHAPVAIHDRGGLHSRPALLAGLAHAESHHHLAPLTRGERRPPRKLVDGERVPALVEHVEALEYRRQRRRQKLLARSEAEQLDGGLVGEQQPAVGCLRGHRVGHPAEDGLQLIARLGGVQARELLQPQELLALAVGAAAVGDVANRAGEHRRIAVDDAADRELHRELAAVGAHAGELHALAEQGRLARLHRPLAARAGGARAGTRARSAPPARRRPPRSRRARTSARRPG